MPFVTLGIRKSAVLPLLLGAILLAVRTSGAGEASSDTWSSLRGRDPAFALPIAGGVDPRNAKWIEFNREYKLSHLQKQGEKDYFYVLLEPGMDLTLELRAFQAPRPLMGLGRLELQDETGTRLRALTVSSPNASRKASYKPSKAGKYFIVLGSEEGAMSKDFAAFKAGARLFAREDAGCGMDAGDRIETAKIIAPILYRDNCLGGDDRKDLFGFWGEKGETYAIEAAAGNGAEASLRMKVFPEETQKVMAQASGPEGRVAIGRLRIPRDDYYFFEVALDGPANEIVPYSLTLSRVGPSE